MARDQKTKRKADQIARDASAGYAGKVPGATPFDFAGLDATGDLIDSGYSATDFADYDAILGDGTAGRILGQAQLLIEDGTVAATLKCTVTSLWNGDAIGATDNVAKGATTGSFTLNAGGTVLTIEAAGLSGNCLMALGVLSSNSTATALNLDCKASGNDIVISVRHTTSGVAQDITGLVGVGATLTIYILYLTDA